MKKKVHPVISAAMSKLGKASWEARKKKMIERAKELQDSKEMKVGNE